jgi:hypothetical protein
MIPVAKVKKPKDFDAKVKASGDQWLIDSARKQIQAAYFTKGSWK